MRRRRLAIQTAETLAVAARRSFRIKRQALVETFKGENAAAHVLLMAEKTYERQLTEYMRKPGATYAAWVAHGPHADIEEMRKSGTGSALRGRP